MSDDDDDDDAAVATATTNRDGSANANANANAGDKRSFPIPESFHENELSLYQNDVVILYNGVGKKDSTQGFSGVGYAYIKTGDRFELVRDLNDPKDKARFDAKEALKIRDANKRLKRLHRSTPKVKIPDRSHLVKAAQHIKGQADLSDSNEQLSKLRQEIECNVNSFSSKDLEGLIDKHPEELAFSLLLCTLRFPGHSEELMDKIFKAIEKYSEAQIDYCILNFRSDMEGKERTADTVISEALILIFNETHDFQATPESGNLEAIKLLRQHYPESILYIDGNRDTPYVRACEVLNMKICQYLINWNVEEKSKDIYHLYNTVKSDILSIIYTSIDTKQNIVQWLQWLHGKGLLTSNDVKKWDLIHRAVQESPYATIEFLINLCPSGVMSKVDDKTLPIHHLGNRNSSFNENDKHAIKSDEDYAITKLLISKGIVQNGGADTIGGLFSRDPDDEKSYTLDVLLRKVGEENHGRLWCIIDECIKEATDGDHTLNMEDMSAALNKYKSEQ